MRRNPDDLTPAEISAGLSFYPAGKFEKFVESAVGGVTGSTGVPGKVNAGNCYKRGVYEYSSEHLRAMFEHSFVRREGKGPDREYETDPVSCGIVFGGG